MEVRQYTVVLENAGSDGWGAYAPDLPGCTAGGQSMEEAFANIQVSLRLWVEHAREAGDVIPVPRIQAASIGIAV